MNYQEPNHSIYQAPVLYQVQSGLQTIVYLNFQYLLQLLSQSQWPRHLHHPQYIYIILDMSYDFRHIPAEIFASNQVRPRPTYLSGLGAINLPTKKPLLFLSML